MSFRIVLVSKQVECMLTGYLIGGQLQRCHQGPALWNAGQKMQEAIMDPTEG